MRGLSHHPHRDATTGTRSGTVGSWAIRQIVAGGAILGRRHRHNPELTASSAKTALAAHNSSARSGCKRWGRARAKPHPREFAGQGGGFGGVENIRHSTTPATNNATAATDAINGMSHGRLVTLPLYARCGALRRGAIPRAAYERAS
jgi:hypothetical protein